MAKKAKIVKTHDIGLGITLDIYSDKTFEFTTPGEVHKDNPDFDKDLKETSKLLAQINPSNEATFNALCSVFNKLLVKNGLPEINITL